MPGRVKAKSYFHGIFGRVESEARGSREGRPQAGRGAREESEPFLADPEHVEVERNDEAGSIDTVPSARVD